MGICYTSHIHHCNQNTTLHRLSTQWHKMNFVRKENANCRVSVIQWANRNKNVYLLLVKAVDYLLNNCLAACIAGHTISTARDASTQRHVQAIATETQFFAKPICSWNWPVPAALSRTPANVAAPQNVLQVCLQCY